jgi:hypothetical protein
MPDVGPAESALIVALTVLAVAAALALLAVVLVAAMAVTTLATLPVASGIRRYGQRNWHPPTSWLPGPDDITEEAPAPRAVRNSPLLVSSSDAGFGDVSLLAVETPSRAAAGARRCCTSTVLHARLRSGADLQLPALPGFHTVIYVLAGRGSIGPTRLPVVAGQLVLAPDRAPSYIHAGRGTAGIDVLVLGEVPARDRLPWPGPIVVSAGPEVPRRLHTAQAMTATPPAWAQPPATAATGRSPNRRVRHRHRRRTSSRPTVRRRSRPRAVMGVVLRHR